MQRRDDFDEERSEDILNHCGTENDSAFQGSNTFMCHNKFHSIVSGAKEELLERRLDKLPLVHYSGHMDNNEATTAFDALSQETRLRVFRLLVEHGRDGAPAGVLSETLGIPHNTLSFHLSHMSHAGLVLSRREGRSIIYKANFEFFNNLIRYMVKDCCRMEFASIREDKKRGCSVIEMPSCCAPQTKEKTS